jgi:hypothetical protein
MKELSKQLIGDRDKILAVFRERDILTEIYSNTNTISLDGTF